MDQYYWIIKYQAVNPKSHKELRKDIADEVGVHNSVVDEFITFYYSKLRKKLSDIDFPRVHVDGLGTFYLRKNKLEKAIKKNKSILGNLAKRTYIGFAKSQEINNNVKQMEAALKQMEIDILNKKWLLYVTMQQKVKFGQIFLVLIQELS